MVNLQDSTPEELGKMWRRLCDRHDNLVDSTDIGDERIYFAQKSMDRIEAEFKRRGLSHHDYIGYP